MEPKNLPEKREGDNLLIPEPIYKIGDTVYHVTQDSPRGLVVDLCYYPMLRSWKYRIAWDFELNNWNEEHEISFTKNL